MAENNNIPALQQNDEADIKEDKDVKNKNVLNLHVVPGGKDPNNPNWLSTLPVGTVFLTRRKPTQGGLNRDIGAAMFHVSFHSDKCTRLFDNMNGAGTYQWVITRDFSMAMEKIEVLQYGEIEVIEDESKDSP